MNWTAYQLVFRLQAPLHVGWGKIGNLQRTRSYLSGRAFWGALVMRLTRDRHGAAGPVTDSTLYQAVSAELLDNLAWSYFYLALRADETWQMQWPWAKAEHFEHHFLRSYASTALVYPQQAAAETTLHEVEYISPTSLDGRAQPVYLCGYVFSRTDAAADWQQTCRSLQFGGERSYGWGRVHLETLEPLPGVGTLFDGEAQVTNLDGARPELQVRANGHLLAHVAPFGERLVGPVEPLVGREWRSTNTVNRHSGAHVAYNGFYLQPGAQANEATRFSIGPLGIWQAE